ncbi:Replicative DNA helicase [Planctomycetes bacterium Pan216]|uniref:Replicative DNA helicase n=1 Tax=Kolteria novifilia TaxID=2527975 RepID=A0A518B9V1_9BACT|nr:Replicative DNA helicase [Planctomycetes bacterium Pan216]
MAAKTTRSASRKMTKSTRELLSETLPPQNLAAERAVLGSILRDNECIADVLPKLGVDDFYSAHHRTMYEAVVDLSNENHPVDPLTLGEELARRGQLLDVGGAPAIVEIYDETLTAANVLHYAQIVREKAVARHLIHACTEILRDAYDESTRPDDLMAESEKKIFRILEDGSSATTIDLASAIKGVFDRISLRHDRDGLALGGVPSGFSDLDEMTDGWKGSEMIVVAARPAMGKTAFALNLVEHAALENNMPVLFCSLEMSALELAERMLCARAQVNGHMLRKGRTGADDMQKLIHASEELSNAPIYIDDTPGQSMLRIASSARRLERERRRHGDKLSMIVIDYLQLIEADDRTASRQEQISVISRRIKNLAKELDVPVIALSQLNRSVESREGHRPRMADLRESGSIEQDADAVLLLHRDDAYNADENPGLADVIVAKQRSGPVGDVRLTFRKELTRFENFSPEMAPFDAANTSF